MGCLAHLAGLGQRSRHRRQRLRLPVRAGDGAGVYLPKGVRQAWEDQHPGLRAPAAVA